MQDEGMNGEDEPTDLGSGWIYPVPVTAEEMEARRAEMRRWARAEDERVTSERVAEFGPASEVEVAAVVMPLSGREFRWRSDGFFTDLGPEDSRDDAEIEWEEWDAQGSLSGIGEWPTLESNEAGRWLCWGLARPAETVTCRLADGTAVPVTRLGYLWIAEWRADPQTLLIDIDDVTETFKWHRPNYRTTSGRPPTD
jgi:hypothetical protein